MMSKNESLLFIIGSSHEQANLEERETFSLKEEEVDLLADDLMNHQSIYLFTSKSCKHFIPKV